MRNAKPPPAEWPIKVSALGIFATQFGDEIGKIIVELADIADVAARTRGAMAARIDRHSRDAAVGERARGRIHFR